MLLDRRIFVSSKGYDHRPAGSEPQYPSGFPPPPPLSLFSHPVPHHLLSPRTIKLTVSSIFTRENFPGRSASVYMFSSCFRFRRIFLDSFIIIESSMLFNEQYPLGRYIYIIRTINESQIRRTMKKCKQNFVGQRRLQSKTITLRR